MYKSCMSGSNDNRGQSKNIFVCPYAKLGGITVLSKGCATVQSVK